MKNPMLQFRQLVAAVLLPMHLAACMTWTVQDTTPRQYVNDEQPEIALITMTNGTQVEFRDPSISGDSLTGRTTTDNVRSIALADIASMSSRTTHTGNTVALIVGLTAVVALIVGGLYIVGQLAQNR